VNHRTPVRFLPLAVLGATVLTPTQESLASISASALKACAAIAAPTDRLACYDQLAGRPTSPAASSAPAATAPSAAVAVSPVAAPNSRVPPAAGPAAAVAPVAPVPPAPKEAFGLYSAEHPTIPAPAALLTATVIGLGVAPNGRPTVTLDGDQVWELDSSDPLLRDGESVTIKRASLGSFLMTTSAGRTHRVHRLH
jgi:hypothetical protein